MHSNTEKSEYRDTFAAAADIAQTPGLESCPGDGGGDKACLKVASHDNFAGRRNEFELRG